MSDKKSPHGLLIRVVSALVLMPVVLYALLYGGWPFLFMVGIAIGISIKEWTAMAKLSPKPFINGVGGIAYILCCFAAFVYLRMHHSEYGAGLAICLLLCVWASDTGAYFAGKAIGGPKMAPTISPNKTWAGMGGAIASSIAAFFLYAHVVGPFLGNAIWSTNNLPEGFIAPLIFLFGAAIAISGQIGDLLISKEKRLVGIKDTGALIPGHGGLLDRIDSVLLAAVVFVIGVKAFGL